MKFRKMPVVIEAWQNVVEGSTSPMPQWLDEACAHDKVRQAVHPVHRGSFYDIITPEGVMTASPGDWIIRGVAGEIYPCKPDIFAATYEPAEASHG